MTGADANRLSTLRMAVKVARGLTHQRALTLAELSHACQVHPRTIRRTISALRGVGIDIVQIPTEPAPRYRLDHRAWAGALSLPADDAAMRHVMEARE
jgi:predicted DNA-binding transcriptional regulator YafY